MAASITSLYPRRYSVEEILSLRSSLPVVNCVVRKLNNHPDIAGIFRIPEEALNDPDRYFCQSQALVEVTNQRKVLQLGSRHTETSTEEGEEQVIPSSKLTNHSRQQHWHLRRRDTLNHSSEPHPAPSGIASQQSENFQRFYRAVVSPTHVRVTAGGRIVPNTRTTAPPQFNWNPEKCLFEPRRPFADIELNTPQSTIASPLPTYNFISQSASVAQATMAAQKLGGLKPSSENGQPQKEATNDPLQPTTLSQPIKISPPSQFDHSRPFMFNGQMVYPVPAGFQPPPNSVPLPISVLGDPNLPHQVPTGNFHPPPFSFPMGGFANPYMVPPAPAGHFPVMLTNGLPPLDGALHMAPYTPQVARGMVSLSELTKCQIQGFRNQIKHIDNQTSSNQHLADDPFLHRQRNELMGFIKKMEVMLQIQLGQEGNQLSMAHLNGNPSVTNSASTGSTSAETMVNVLSAQGENNKNGPDGYTLKTRLSPVSSTEELKKKGSNAVSEALATPARLSIPDSQPLGTQTKTERPKATNPSTESKPLSKSEPATKSRLTAAAAKAPPFQPRAYTMARRSESEPASDVATQSSPEPRFPIHPTTNLITPYFGGYGARRDTTSSTEWAQFPTGLGHASLSRTHSIQPPKNLNDNHSPILQRYSTFHANSTIQEAATLEATGKAPPISPSAVPYLVGSLPIGMHISEVKGSDIVYGRPLTEQEIRARHLYWGNAPRSATKGSGLPKFDGKDFYPPSPVKREALSTDSEAKCKSTTVALPDFEQLFNEPVVPGYQTPDQVRHKSSEQNFMPSPTTAFLENGVIGYHSPSPRPATYKFENKLPPNWPPTKYDSNGVLLQKRAAQPAFTETTNPVADDFSTLFTSPTAPCNGHSNNSFQNRSIAQPTTPSNKALSESIGGEDYETRNLDSWGAPKAVGEWDPESLEEVASNKSNANHSHSTGSTVEIRLTSKDKDESPKRGYGTSYADRMAKVHGDQHISFMKNMLRNAAASATMAAPALSGRVSSATAQGYLPQYRGSAAASLAPAMLNISTLKREDEIASMKVDEPKASMGNDIKVSLEGVAPLIAANFLPENRPTDRDRPRRPILASVETMGAEAYMRYLAQKADNDKKILEQGWNSNTTGKGPVMGSDW